MAVSSNSSNSKPFDFKPAIIIQADPENSDLIKTLIRQTEEEFLVRQERLLKTLEQEKNRADRAEKEFLTLLKTLEQEENKAAQAEKELLTLLKTLEQEENKAAQAEKKLLALQEILEQEENRANRAEKELQIEKLQRAELKQDILIVDGGENGYATINKALQDASDQTIIRVMSGNYQESLVLDKDVSIIGVGKRENIVISGRWRNTIFSSAKHARLQNLTLRQIDNENACIEISDGELTIERCDISGGKNCIAIYGDQTMPILVNNLIHDSLGNGLSVTSNAMPIVCDNHIYNNKKDGINIYNHSKGIFERNNIFNNEWSGISINKSADSIVCNNDIYSNDNGVRVRNADSIICKNKSYNNKQSGIYIYENSTVIVKENDSFNNKRHNFYISRNCTIFKSK